MIRRLKYENIYLIKDVLPDTLEELECTPGKAYYDSENPYYYCNYKHLQVLPKLPLMLKDLCVKHNMLQCLPELPNTLLTLDCTANQLKELPNLPLNLIKLDCHGNRLQKLPNLPDTLNHLWVRKNCLIVLPKLPPKLISLNCTSNRLTILPELPLSLIELECDYNKLNILPDIPNKIVIHFNVSEYNILNENIYYNYVLKNSSLISINSHFILTAECVNFVNNKMKKFKHLVYCIIFKKQFILWLEKIKQKKLLNKKIGLFRRLLKYFN